MDAFVTPLLEPGEVIKVVVPHGQTGSQAVRSLSGVFGLVGKMVATIAFGHKTYALVVTDRRLLIVEKCNWTGNPKRLAVAIPLGQPIGAEFDDRGLFRELQLSRLAGFESGYLNLWVPKRYADALTQFRS